MEDIMKTVNYLEASDVLIKGITKSIENKTKQKASRFIGIFRLLQALVYQDRCQLENLK